MALPVNPLVRITEPGQPEIFIRMLKAIELGKTYWYYSVWFDAPPVKVTAYSPYLGEM